MSNLVEEMLASTSKDVAVFQKFILDYNNYNNTLFYFVEGKDFCYYNPRIQKYINNFEITHYKCGGKKHVIGVYELIKNNIKYNNGNKMLYFVDKDYGFNNELISNEIYVTDLYSIENFYLNKDTIKRILTEFMEIDIHTQNYKMAMFYFEKCYDEYSIFGKNINAFLYTVRFYEKERKLKRTDFNIKFSKFLLNKSLPCYKFKEYSFKDFVEEFNLGFEVNESEYNKNLSLFSKNDHFNFRGKYELEFLKNYLNLIRRSINSGSDGFEMEDICQIDFNCETMKLFSEYAYTPKNLIDYLKRNQ